MEDSTGKQYSFPQKVWVVGGIFSLIVVLILLIKTTFSVWLLILAGSLIAVLFRTSAVLFKGKLSGRRKVTLPIAIIGSLLIFGLISTLIGTKVQSQAKELRETLRLQLKMQRII
jgi:predicted PurR-regulated permease PerM